MALSSLGAAGQGSPLPNITTTQGTATTAPAYYDQYLANLTGEGNQAVQNAKFVGPTGLQNQAFTDVSNNVGNYQPALGTAQGALTSSAQGPNISAYMNPFIGNVVSEQEQLGQQAINQSIPGLNAAAIGSGQSGSSRNQNATNQALAQAELGLNANVGSTLAQGYNQSVQNALQGQANQTQAGSALNNLATNTQNLGLGDVNALATLGGQQQQIAQNQQLFPMQQLTSESNLLKGLTVPTSTASTYTGPIPGAYQASPLQQVAGLGTLLAGLNTTGTGGTTPLSNLLTSISPSSGGTISGLLSSFFPSTPTTSTATQQTVDPTATQNWLNQFESSPASQQLPSQNSGSDTSNTASNITTSHSEGGSVVMPDLILPETKKRSRSKKTRKE